MTPPRERYEPPRMVKQEFLLPDKQPVGGHAHPVAVQDAIDGVAVRTLRAEHGSPLYVVSEATLRKNFRAFLGAFRGRYPETTVAYSYKTNYVSGVCAILHEEGAWAEVVSGFELAHARRLGVSGEDIVYNGPYKPFEHLLQALEQGSHVNADNVEELSDLEEAARKLGRPVKIGIRVNLRVNDPPWDKFGFNLESGHALEVARTIGASRHLRLAGLHLHAGTYLASTDIYHRAMKRLVDFGKTIEARGLGEIEYLDLGGGYASGNTVMGQLLPGEMTAPSYAEYAEAICGPLRAHARAFRRRPRLVLEPGRAIVDDAVSLLASVVAVKTTPDGRKLVVVDAGVNLLPTAYYFRHDVATERPPEGRAESVDVVGALCMQVDVLRRDVVLPPVGRGTILVFQHAGAYTISNSMQFIYPRPAVVLVRGKEVHVLRRAERGEDLVSLDEMPAHLVAGRKRGRTPAGRADGRARGTR